jgi:hypothetical protein
MRVSRVGSRGSRRAATEAEVRKLVLRVDERLERGLRLARIAVRGETAGFAARHITQALKVLGPELRALRRAARSAA